LERLQSSAGWRLHRRQRRQLEQDLERDPLGQCQRQHALLVRHAGLAEDEAFGSYSDSGKPGTGAFISAGVGFDSNTTFSGRTGFQNNPSNAAPIFGDFTIVAMGFHYFQALEYSSNNNAATFYGDSGVPPIAQNGLYCRLRM